ncbi:MAG: hypothetical protein JNL52_08660 [Flavobacteriales bacterium]|nr:hypothetical protein [Flavobacteriales bacterium]
MQTLIATVIVLAAVGYMAWVWMPKREQTAPTASDAACNMCGSCSGCGRA